MSRAINLNLTEAEIVRRCNDAQIGVSVIEPLPNGGTRLVCSTNEGAEQMRRKYVKDILDGAQKRFPVYVAQLQR